MSLYYGFWGVYLGVFLCRETTISISSTKPPGGYPERRPYSKQNHTPKKKMVDSPKLGVPFFRCLYTMVFGGSILGFSCVGKLPYLSAQRSLQVGTLKGGLCRLHTALASLESHLSRLWGYPPGNCLTTQLGVS